MTKTAVALALALACGAASAQTLYKCVQGGKTVYQDSKCEDTAKQSEVKAPAPLSGAPQPPPDAKPAASAKPAADAKPSPDGKAPLGDKAPAQPSPSSELDAAIDVMAGYQACSEGIFEWEGAHRSAYDEWRVRQGMLVSRIENEAEAQRRFAQKVQDFRAGSTRTCANVIAVINPSRADFMKDVRPNLAVPRPGSR